jgi:formylmethanofuran dehydrogenase subunit A
MTRAGIAQALNLPNKGHLGVGADADVAVYNLNPDLVTTLDPVQLENIFHRAMYTIKGGEIVVKQGDIVKSVNGSTYWTDINTKDPLKVEADVKNRFTQYWTVQYENYPIPERYLHSSHPIPIRAEV